MGRELAGAEISVREQQIVQSDWKVAQLGGGVALARGYQTNITARRDARHLGDGDADFSIFWVDEGAVPFEQNDRRTVLAPGAALLVAHGQPVQSIWDDSHHMVLRVPRAALTRSGCHDAAAGSIVRMDTAAGRLLRAYVDAVWGMLDDADIPAFAERHLCELAAAAIDVSTSYAQDIAKGDASQAARFVTMREIVSRRFRDPALSMAKVAAELGLSERSGYQIFEQAEVSFTDLLYATRLDRVREVLIAAPARRILDIALDVGFSDLSHFNRRFRQRFGTSPGDVRRQPSA